MGSGPWPQPPPGVRVRTRGAPAPPSPPRGRRPSEARSRLVRGPTACGRDSVNHRLPRGPTARASRVSVRGAHCVLGCRVAHLPDREVLRGPHPRHCHGGPWSPLVAGPGGETAFRTSTSTWGGRPGGVRPVGPGEAGLRGSWGGTRAGGARGRPRRDLLPGPAVSFLSGAHRAGSAGQGAPPAPLQGGGGTPEIAAG